MGKATIEVITGESDVWCPVDGFMMACKQGRCCVHYLGRKTGKRMDVYPELEALVSIDGVMQVPIGLIEVYGGGWGLGSADVRDKWFIAKGVPWYDATE